MIEHVVKPETDGFIATKMDENGDKELVPISEVIAKTLKEYKKDILTNLPN